MLLVSCAPQLAENSSPQKFTRYSRLFWWNLRWIFHYV